MNNRHHLIPGFVYLLLEDDERRNFMRIHRRYLRDTNNPFEMPNEAFKKLYRLNKVVTLDLINWLTPHIIPFGRRSTALPFYLKVLATLNFLAYGSYQTGVGVSCWTAMSQASISRCVSEICRLIVAVLMPEWIKFPTGEDNKRKTKMEFYEMSGFRGVVGCIDGSHVQIVSPPSTDEDHPPHTYINRKGVHTINVMMTCDANCNITVCDARYPCSVHDAAIWKMSQIRNYMKEQYGNGDRKSILIGDSGYGLEPWLFTPFSVVVDGTPQAEFNRLLRSTRNVVERSFGILKGRWRCLLKHRVLHYHPATAVYLIYAAVILHNIAQWARIEIDEEDIYYENDDDDDDLNNEDFEQHMQNDNFLQLGRTVRDEYIRTNIIQAY